MAGACTLDTLSRDRTLRALQHITDMGAYDHSPESQALSVSIAAAAQRCLALSREPRLDSDRTVEVFLPSVGHLDAMKRIYKHLSDVDAQIDEMIGQSKPPEEIGVDVTNLVQQQHRLLERMLDSVTQLLASLLPPQPTNRSASESDEEDGETLQEIAESTGYSIATLKEWNPSLATLHIMDVVPSGTSIRLPPPESVAASATVPMKAVAAAALAAAVSAASDAVIGSPQAQRPSSAPSATHSDDEIGETLEDIAKKAQIPLEDMIALNRDVVALFDPVSDLIPVGTPVRIPESAARRLLASTSPRRHQTASAAGFEDVAPAAVASVMSQAFSHSETLRDIAHATGASVENLRNANPELAGVALDVPLPPDTKVVIPTIVAAGLASNGDDVDDAESFHESETPTATNTTIDDTAAATESKAGGLRGDTLDDIASLYGVSIQALLASNPHLASCKPGDVLPVGTAVQIPQWTDVDSKTHTEVASPAAEFAPSSSATTAPTLADIALATGFTTEQIRHWNPFLKLISDDQILTPGLPIRIAETSSSPTHEETEVSVLNVNGEEAHQVTTTRSSSTVDSIDEPLRNEPSPPQDFSSTPALQPAIAMRTSLNDGALTSSSANSNASETELPEDTQTPDGRADHPLRDRVDVEGPARELSEGDEGESTHPNAPGIAASGAQRDGNDAVDVASSEDRVQPRQNPVMRPPRAGGASIPNRAPSLRALARSNGCTVDDLRKCNPQLLHYPAHLPLPLSAVVALPTSETDSESPLSNDDQEPQPARGSGAVGIRQGEDSDHTSNPSHGVIGAGESLESIASRNGISVDALLACNPSLRLCSPSAILPPGFLVSVPEPAAASEQADVYDEHEPRQMATTHPNGTIDYLDTANTAPVVVVEATPGTVVFGQERMDEDEVEYEEATDMVPRENTPPTDTTHDASQHIENELALQTGGDFLSPSRVDADFEWRQHVDRLTQDHNNAAAVSSHVVANHDGGDAQEFVQVDVFTAGQSTPSSGSTTPNDSALEPTTANQPSNGGRRSRGSSEVSAASSAESAPTPSVRVDGPMTIVDFCRTFGVLELDLRAANAPALDGMPPWHVLQEGLVLELPPTVSSQVVASAAPQQPVAQSITATVDASRATNDGSRATLENSSNAATHQRMSTLPPPSLSEIRNKRELSQRNAHPTRAVEHDAIAGVMSVREQADEGVVTPRRSQQMTPSTVVTDGTTTVQEICQRYFLRPDQLRSWNPFLARYHLQTIIPTGTPVRIADSDREQETAAHITIDTPKATVRSPHTTRLPVYITVHRNRSSGQCPTLADVAAAHRISLPHARRMNPHLVNVHGALEENTAVCIHTSSLVRWGGNVPRDILKAVDLMFSKSAQLLMQRYFLMWKVLSTVAGSKAHLAQAVVHDEKQQLLREVEVSRMAELDLRRRVTELRMVVDCMRSTALTKPFSAASTRSPGRVGDENIVTPRSAMHAFSIPNIQQLSLDRASAAIASTSSPRGSRTQSPSRQIQPVVADIRGLPWKLQPQQIASISPQRPPFSPRRGSPHVETYSPAPNSQRTSRNPSPAADSQNQGAQRTISPRRGQKRSLGLMLNGLRVVGVSGSAAAAGIQVNDAILRVDGKLVSNAPAFREAVAKAPGPRVCITVQHLGGGSTAFFVPLFASIVALPQHPPLLRTAHSTDPHNSHLNASPHRPTSSPQRRHTPKPRSLC